MTFAKSCPGSRSIRQPVPEDIKCPSCGVDVEIWTDELSQLCPSCGTRVFREQLPSCIDWCPAAKECIGPEVYQRLKPEAEKVSVKTKTASPLDVISQEHDEVLNQMSFLRAATLCIRSGARATVPESSKILELGMNNLRQVLEFFDSELRLHFRLEEETLFPILERHMGKEGSPTRLLLAEHAQLWPLYDKLKDEVGEFQKDDSEPSKATEIYKIGNRIVGLLRGHIEKENTSLLPIARSLLGEKELAEISSKWQSLSV